MVDVVSGLAAEMELQCAGSLGGLVCSTRAESRAEIPSGGARMRAKRMKMERMVR
jgi:hypothetical protein